MEKIKKFSIATVLLLVLFAILLILLSGCKKEETGTCRCDDHTTSLGQQDYKGLSQEQCLKMSLEMQKHYPDGYCNFQP